MTISDPDDIAGSVRVDWGDGVVTDGNILESSVILAHQYGSTGTYTITISVTSEHYLVPDSMMRVIVVSDLLTEGMVKTVDGLTATITHSTKTELDGIERVIQIKWGDE